MKMQSQVDPANVKLFSYVLIVLSLIALYLPVFVNLFNTVWSTTKQSHGPIVFAIGIWFFYFKSKQLADLIPTAKPNHMAGWLALATGLIVYVAGHSQDFVILEVLSFIIVLLGLMLLILGRTLTQKYWFSIFFFAFMIPWPESLVDAVTQPMKIAVSIVVEQLLFYFDYPIARTGVIIDIGQYKLLVADACAGLNSLFTLEAIGLLYINVVNHQSVKRNVLLAILILPISFFSNVLRVCLLALITYYMGDAAAQGFLHNFSGMLLFMTALILIIFVDSVIQRLADYIEKRRGALSHVE